MMTVSEFMNMGVVVWNAESGTNIGKHFMQILPFKYLTIFVKGRVVISD